MKCSMTDLALFTDALHALCSIMIISVTHWSPESVCILHPSGALSSSLQMDVICRPSKPTRRGRFWYGTFPIHQFCSRGSTTHLDVFCFYLFIFFNKLERVTAIVIPVAYQFNDVLLSPSPLRGSAKTNKKKKEPSLAP